MSAFVIKEMLKKQTMESLREYLGIVAVEPEPEAEGFAMQSAALAPAVEKAAVEKAAVVEDAPVVANANRIRRPRRSSPR